MARLPGVHVEDRLPVAAPAPAIQSGVPAFIGFARPAPRGRRRALGTLIERWDARAFDELIGASPQGFLRAAVRGFFANGGQRCVVLTVDEPGAGAAGAAALRRVLEDGGPLEDRSDIDLVCIPDAVSPLGGGDGQSLRAIHEAALAHCQKMGDRFAILDAPPPPAGADDAAATDDALNWTASLKSAFGAIYFPWLVAAPAREASAPARSSPGRAQWRCEAAGPPSERPVDAAAPQPTGYIPPCGHVAGVFARIDARVGAQWSPANEMLDGVTDVAVHLTAAQRAQLNDAGVNCLRSRPGRGIELGGARTLSGQALWAHVSTARVVLGFRRWLAWGLRDLVFEPLTPLLRDRIRSRIVAHCLELQRAGALAGTEGSPGFFVKCDAETNPPEDVDQGRVIAAVGLAPSVPAEFIVVRVVHDASGFTVSGLS